MLVATVPCVSCGEPVAAARAAIKVTKGQCVACNAPTLACNQRDVAPMYETDAWAKGIKL